MHRIELCFVDVELANVRSEASYYLKLDMTTECTERTEALRATQS
ncbi:MULTISPECIES: hypothetical protein [Pseudoalteromonas]|nr:MULTISPECIES: hypothetical protein [Pseudoalteromonas]SIO23012.1 hypothetical protein SAMN05878071_3400 [Pseudoalteromonas marina]